MPTQQFWTAEEKIPISQKKVSILAENGLSYDLGQQVNFVIPASTGYMMPSETYLRMDVRVQYPDSASGIPITLDGDLGANVLIRDCRISSGGAQNVLLEELQNVNVLTALKYDFETNDNIKKKRALTEGTILESNVSRPNQGTTSTNMNNLDTNPYFSSSNGSQLVNSDYRTVKALLKLPTGIFQNDKIFPLAMTSGLRIEIILEDANKVFRQLETGLKNKRNEANPLFHSINGSNDAPDDWISGSSQSHFYVARDNGNISLDTCPFFVGDTLAFAKGGSASDAAPLDSRVKKSGSDADDIVKVVVTSVIYDTTVGTANASGGLVKIGFAATENKWYTDIDDTYSVYSCGVDEATSFNPTCSVDNVELIVQQVEMPQGYTAKMNQMLQAGGSMIYDFLSYTNYKYSQLASDRVVNIRLPIQNSRCKSVLAIPTDATPYSSKQSIFSGDTYQVNSLTRDCGASNAAYTANHSTRSGLVGIADHASNYQFIYDGKLNPNRKVPLGRVSVNTGNEAPLNQQLFIENEKALRMANIDPLSYEKYQENFFIGRAFSLASGVYDARGKDFNLQVEYQESTAPTKAKLWNCWVAHLRRIVVRGDSIAVEV
tara:strand:+ start:5004 stop:6815 length:1812 start_codon:yes stop_codon:yes gene_type:complete